MSIHGKKEGLVGLLERPRVFLPYFVLLIILAIVVMRLFCKDMTDDQSGLIARILDGLMILLSMVFGFYFQEHNKKKD